MWVRGKNPRVARTGINMRYLSTENWRYMCVTLNRVSWPDPVRLCNVHTVRSLASRNESIRQLWEVGKRMREGGGEGKGTYRESGMDDVNVNPKPVGNWKSLMQLRDLLCVCVCARAPVCVRVFPCAVFSGVLFISSTCGSSSNLYLWQFIFRIPIKSYRSYIISMKLVSIEIFVDYNWQDNCHVDFIFDWIFTSIKYT